MSLAHGIRARSILRYYVNGGLEIDDQGSCPIGFPVSFGEEGFDRVQPRPRGRIRLSHAAIFAMPSWRAEGKVEGKIQIAIGGVKDTLKT